MSEFLEQVVGELNGRLEGGDIGGSAKFVMEGEGAVMVDDSGARVGDDAADVTLSADADTFRAIFAGEENATAAFMAGKLTVDGDMGLAMKLASVLA
jgi:putative sterol carrier protein